MPRLAPHFIRLGFFVAFGFVAPLARADVVSSELRSKGNDAMDRLDYAEALDAYEKARAADPNDVAVLYNIGRVQQAREDFPAALEALESFRALAPPELRARLPKLDELIVEVKGKVAFLRVRCTNEAPDAKVFAGGREVALSCGSASRAVRANAPKKGTLLEVRVESAHFRSETRRLSVDGGGDPVDVELVLVPRTNSGLLRLRTQPPGAEIWIDGMRRGNPPLEVPLEAGAHRVQAKLDGFHDVDTQVLIDADAVKSVEIPLGKTLPITTRWWFWTAIGAGVLATTGVVTYLVVKDTERAAGDGSLGQIAAPLVTF